MNIKVYSRSMNGDLWTKMRSLIPDHIECIRCDNFQQWWEASDYLYHILQSDADIVVNVDDDCFIKDWNRVERLIEYMAANNYHYAGMPDGGVCPHRCRSWVVMNPFFNVFHVERMREVLSKYPKWVVNSAGFQADWHNLTPDIVTGSYNHDYVEPFSSLFYFLYDKFSPLYLGAHQHEDGISTILEHQGAHIAHHAWYSREFSVDPTHRNRILSLFNEVKQCHSAS